MLFAQIPRLMALTTLWVFSVILLLSSEWAYGNPRILPTLEDLYAIFTAPVPPTNYGWELFSDSPEKLADPGTRAFMDEANRLIKSDSTLWTMAQEGRQNLEHIQKYFLTHVGAEDVDLALDPISEIADRIDFLQSPRAMIEPSTLRDHERVLRAEAAVRSRYILWPGENPSGLSATRGTGREMTIGRAYARELWRLDESQSTSPLISRAPLTQQVLNRWRKNTIHRLKIIRDQLTKFYIAQYQQLSGNRPIKLKIVFQSDSNRYRTLSIPPHVFLNAEFKFTTDDFDIYVNAPSWDSTLILPERVLQDTQISSRDRVFLKNYQRPDGRIYIGLNWAQWLEEAGEIVELINPISKQGIEVADYLLFYYLEETLVRHIAVDALLSEKNISLGELQRRLNGDRLRYRAGNRRADFDQQLRMSTNRLSQRSKWSPLNGIFWWGFGVHVNFWNHRALLAWDIGDEYFDSEERRSELLNQHWSWIKRTFGGWSSQKTFRDALKGQELSQFKDFARMAAEYKLSVLKIDVPPSSPLRKLQWPYKINWTYLFRLGKEPISHNPASGDDFKDTNQSEATPALASESVLHFRDDDAESDQDLDLNFQLTRNPEMLLNDSQIPRMFLQPTVENVRWARKNNIPLNPLAQQTRSSSTSGLFQITLKTRHPRHGNTIGLIVPRGFEPRIISVIRGNGQSIQNSEFEILEIGKTNLFILKFSTEVSFVVGELLSLQVDYFKGAAKFEDGNLLQEELSDLDRRALKEVSEEAGRDGLKAVSESLNHLLESKKKLGINEISQTLKNKSFYGTDVLQELNFPTTPAPTGVFKRLHQFLDSDNILHYRCTQAAEFASLFFRFLFKLTGARHHVLKIHALIQNGTGQFYVTRHELVSIVAFDGGEFVDVDITPPEPSLSAEDHHGEDREETLGRESKRDGEDLLDPALPRPTSQPQPGSLQNERKESKGIASLREALIKELTSRFKQAKAEWRNNDQIGDLGKPLSVSSDILGISRLLEIAKIVDQFDIAINAETGIAPINTKALRTELETLRSQWWKIAESKMRFHSIRWYWIYYYSVPSISEIFFALLKTTETHLNLAEQHLLKKSAVTSDREDSRRTSHPFLSGALSCSQVHRR